MRWLIQKLGVILNFFIPPDDPIPTCQWCLSDEGCDCQRRVDCSQAGTLGHMGCGLCECGKPRFLCSCAYQKVEAHEPYQKEDHPPFLLTDEKETGWAPLLEIGGKFKTEEMRQQLHAHVAEALNRNFVGQKATPDMLEARQGFLRNLLLQLTEEGALYKDTIFDEWVWEIPLIKMEKKI